MEPGRVVGLQLPTGHFALATVLRIENDRVTLTFDLRGEPVRSTLPMRSFKKVGASWIAEP